jgi:hypothetical protein
MNKADKLTRVRGLTTTSQGTLFIRPYYNQGYVVIGSLNGNSTLQLDLLTMDDPSAERSVELLLCNTCIYGNGYSFTNKKTNGHIATIIDFNSKPTKLKLYGVDFNSKLNSIYDHNILGYIQTFGGSSGNFASDHLLHLYVYDQQPVFSGAYKVPLGWKLPDNAQFNDGDRFTQLINNG